MAYATISHVEALAPNRTIGTSSVPNASQVGLYLDQVAAQIDGILSEARYTTPVPSTATVAWKIIEEINAIGAWAKTELAAAVSSERDRAEALWEQCQKMLRDGTVNLGGLGRDANTAYPRYPKDTGSPMFSPSMMF